MWIEWMRYAGWILTCPVLLMTLVSMTTQDGTKAPTVRLVPLLVANLTMVLLGITAAGRVGLRCTSETGRRYSLSSSAFVLKGGKK